MKTVSRNLKDIEIEELDLKGKPSVTVTDYGYGEQAILTALLNPDTHVTAVIPDYEMRRIAEVAAMDFIDNIEFTK